MLHPNEPHARPSAVRTRLDQIEAAVDTLAAGLAAQQEALDRLVGYLGVVVPDWHSLTEVNEGDEMGGALLSAAALGLAVEVVPLQREPGFAHEEVVRLEPPGARWSCAAPPCASTSTSRADLRARWSGLPAGQEQPVPAVVPRADHAELPAPCGSAPSRLPPTSYGQPQRRRSGRGLAESRSTASPPRRLSPAASEHESR